MTTTTKAIPEPMNFDPDLTMCGRMVDMLSLVQLVKSGKGDPSAVTDAIWDAGYRQPERTVEEAAQVTIDTFFYCESICLPSDLWPRNYDSILQNELMKAVVGEDFELDDADPVVIARSVIKAGFKLSAELAKPVVKASPRIGSAEGLSSDDTGGADV